MGFELQSNVQNLEGELEEVQDNFREDEVDEYRHLKRDLEATAKNCRVLQFKLKKAEKTIVELSASGGGAGGGAVGDCEDHPVQGPGDLSPQVPAGGWSGGCRAGVVSVSRGSSGEEELVFVTELSC